jgi:copper chaperone CopZ
LPLAPARPERSASIEGVTLRSETVQVSGIRCERCVARLAGALRGHEGLEAANANLIGQVSLTWDEERTTRDAVLAAMAKAGFREQQTV